MVVVRDFGDPSIRIAILHEGDLKRRIFDEPGEIVIRDVAATSGSGIPFGRGARIRNTRYCGNRRDNCCCRDGRNRGRGDYNESSKP
jgi:hypothetical protein